MDYKYLTNGIQHEKSGLELIHITKYYAADVEQAWSGDYLFISISKYKERTPAQRTYKGYALLHSLLVLGGQFIDETGMVINSDPGNPLYVDDKTFFTNYPGISKLALEWCKKWGIPWIDDKDNSPILGFPVMEMYASVCHLYQNWILWNAIQQDDIQMARRAVFGFSPLTDTAKNVGWNRIKPRLLADANWEIRMGAHRIHQTRDSITPMLLSKDDGTYSMVYCGRNLVQFAFVQLISYIATGGKRLKRCKVCLAPFFPDKGQEQYCPDCQKQRKAINKRLERQRKKEKGGENGNGKVTNA